MHINTHSLNGKDKAGQRAGFMNTIYLDQQAMRGSRISQEADMWYNDTRIYRELYGLSYPGIMWPLPSEARVRSQGTRMAFSNIDGESVEGMKSN